jgi:hypothetical protein
MKARSKVFIIQNLHLQAHLFQVNIKVKLVSIHKWPFLPCSAFSAGFRLRRTDVRLTENPCAALIRTKIAHLCIGHPSCSFCMRVWELTGIHKITYAGFILAVLDILSKLV